MFRMGFNILNWNHHPELSFLTMQSYAGCIFYSSKYTSLCFASGIYQWLRDDTFGEGNGTPLQYSCLENPVDGGAWQAAVHGVTKSRTRLSNFTFTHWRRKWQPTPVFLPGESQGWESPVGCRLWSSTESDMTEVTQQQQG